MITPDGSGGELEGLRSDIRRDDARELRAAKIGIAVRALLIVFVAGYMAWILGAVSKLDARSLTRIAADRVEESVPRWRAEVRDYAISAAPMLTDQARDLFLELPVRFRESIELQAMSQTDRLIELLEDDVSAALTTVLDDQLAAMQEAVPGVSPEDQLDLLILGVSGTFRDTMTEALEVFYQDYSAEAGKLNAHLDRLLAAEDLTEAERIDRRLLEAWMILVHEHGIIDFEMVAELGSGL
jgi:hypothetical protein